MCCVGWVLSATTTRESRNETLPLLSHAETRWAGDVPPVGLVRLQLPMADRRLQRATHLAAAAASQPDAASEIDSLLAAMGGSVPAPTPAAAFSPQLTDVGEAVWEPNVHASLLPTAAGLPDSPPSVTMELRRRKAMRQLQAGIEKACLRVLGPSLCASIELHSSVTLRNGNGLVERWAMCRNAAAARGAPGRVSDPLLPPGRSGGGDDAELLAELAEAGAAEAKATEAAAAMAAEAEAALRWLRRQREDARQSTEVSVRTALPPPQQRGGFVDAAAAMRGGSAGGRGRGGGGSGSGGGAAMLEVKCGKVALPLSAAHRDKLWELYCRTQGRRVGPRPLQPWPQPSEPTPRPSPGPAPRTRPGGAHRAGLPPRPLLPAASVRLARRGGLPGGAQPPRLRGPPPPLRLRGRVLRLAVRPVCASPPGPAEQSTSNTGPADDRCIRHSSRAWARCRDSLNCRYARFCSAFADVDAPFGSLGDFFGAKFAEGGYEANPPFVPKLIGRMAERMNSQLRSAEAAGRALSFVVIVPHWRPDKAADALGASPFLRRTLTAANRQHAYHEGAQHAKRPNKLRASTCDTAIFFLQSGGGAAKWPASDAACDELLAALSGLPSGAAPPSLEAASGEAQAARAAATGAAAKEATKAAAVETARAAAAAMQSTSFVPAASMRRAKMKRPRRRSALAIALRRSLLTALCTSRP